MTARSARYDRLARLFDYPHQGDYGAMLTGCLDELQQDYPEVAEQIRPLRDHVADLTLEEVQELYTRTFDINPVCTLEIGWHIYGEDYARGELLVKMRQQLRVAQLTESQELPDHLTHMLALLGRLDDRESDELVARFLLPGLDKMLAGVKQGASPYRTLLQAVVTMLRQDHDVRAVTPRERRSDPPGLKDPLPVFGAQSCAAGCGGSGGEGESKP